MGFRTGAYATVWEVKQETDTRTKGRISVSRKNEQTGKYEQSFSGFVDFVGSVAARNASTLKEMDRIRLGDVDVTTNYDKEKNITYTNYKIFSFEAQEKKVDSSPSPAGYDGDPAMIDDSITEDCMLPF